MRIKNLILVSIILLLLSCLNGKNREGNDDTYYVNLPENPTDSLKYIDQRKNVWVWNARLMMWGFTTPQGSLYYYHPENKVWKDGVTTNRVKAPIQVRTKPNRPTTQTRTRITPIRPVVRPHI